MQKLFFLFCKCIVSIALAGTLLISCKKENMNRVSSIEFSVDTLHFDTVFTSLGSFTSAIKIYNRSNHMTRLSSVFLEKGDNSFFLINVNGVANDKVNEIDIAPNDSIYVFATVNIDPTNDNLPFIVEDELIVHTNEREYRIPFIAYGQNAYYIKDSVLTTQTWKIDKPYVLMGYTIVDELNTLTIPAGCRIYCHADARIFVLGTLKAIGTKKDSIIFQGDRLDRKYFGNEGYPGEWGGIYIDARSRENVLEYVILKNCGNSTKINGVSTLPAAIQVNHDTSALFDYQLTMRNSIIENSIGYGLLCFNAAVRAENCLINACGAQALALFQGGFYRIYNCDFIVYGGNKINHIDNPVSVILNYYPIDDNTILGGHLDAELKNCIIWGTLDDEAVFDKKGSGDYKLILENSLIKSKKLIPDYVSSKSLIINHEPVFVNPSDWNFRLNVGSPAINSGVSITSILTDIDGKMRDGAIDIGCYEF